MENQDAVAVYYNGISRARVFRDRLEFSRIFERKYLISDIKGCRLGWALPGDKTLHIILWNGTEVAGPALLRADAEACKVQLDRLISEYARRTGINTGIAIGCTVLGGTVTKLLPEGNCIAVFSDGGVTIVQGEEVIEVESTKITRVDISGPGEVTSGGGFIGGGIGIEGAAQGIAIAALLNSLASSSEINTVIHIEWNDSEAFLHTSTDEPEALRVKLSTFFVRIASNRRPESQSDLSTQLERLRDLRRAGDLSDEEFDSAKRKLLR
jgi:hypothetical protein